MCTGFEAEKKSHHAQLLKDVENAMYQDYGETFIVKMIYFSIF